MAATYLSHVNLSDKHLLLQGRRGLPQQYLNQPGFYSEMFHFFGTRAMSLSSRYFLRTVETSLCGNAFCMCKTQHGYKTGGGLILHSADLQSAEFYLADIYRCGDYPQM